MGLIKAGFSSGMTLPDGTIVATTENIILPGLRRLDFQRHSITDCTCSFCDPRSMTTMTKLGHPGRFEIHVPPKGNRWKWTQFTWRVGAWQYYLKFNVQLFPSVEPFCKKEKWEEHEPRLPNV